MKHAEALLHSSEGAGSEHGLCVHCPDLTLTLTQQGDGNSCVPQWPCNMEITTVSGLSLPLAKL